MSEVTMVSMPIEVGGSMPMDVATSVSVSDSFELWHQVTCRNYSNSELRRSDDGPFAAGISMRPFGPVGLSDVWSSSGAAQLIRGTDDIRRDQRDHFMLFHVTDGGIGLEQDGRQAQAEAGDLFLYDQTRPLRLNFKPHYRAWMLSIPRPMLEQRVSRSQALTASLVSGSSALGTFTGGIIRQLEGIGASEERHVIERVAGSALDIISATFEAEAGLELSSRTAPHRLLARAEAFIRTNLHDPALDIGTIARAMNTSQRTLNRAFARNGTTPMRWLWQQRLAGADHALAVSPGKSVMDIAFSYGFSDVSHFSRTFKKAFGTSPRARRRR